MQPKDALRDNCLFPYICSFLNATDLIRSRCVCYSWENLYQYATYWIQVSCVPSSILTKMLLKMRELIYCDVMVLSEGKTWDLIIRSHMKLTYLRIQHPVQKAWNGGKCQIGLLPKLHTLEIHDGERSSDIVSSQFDHILIKTPRLQKLSVYNFMIPDHCIPSSISRLKMRTKNRSVFVCATNNYNLYHCTKLRYIWCEPSIFQNQRFEIFSQTVQFCYCDSVYNFGFVCPNLKWMCIRKWTFSLPSVDLMQELAQQHPHLQKLFVTFRFNQKLLMPTYANQSIKLVQLFTSKQFEVMVVEQLRK